MSLHPVEPLASIDFKGGVDLVYFCNCWSLMWVWLQQWVVLLKTHEERGKFNVCTYTDLSYHVCCVVRVVLEVTSGTQAVLPCCRK